ncbi:MAG: Holliday junction resolvase RuvX [Candidatus Sumerlaeota bacterium]|nr:Holliday junction resolvase RuvX [Candidatus Sumerlaeota bacterium]
MDDAAKSLPRHLALDLGKRRIGVAVSDPLGGRSRPLPVIERRNDQQAVEAIARLMDAYEIRVCVAGLPLNMDGSEGAQALWARSFVGRLRKERPGATYVWHDERLSTFAANEFMKAAGMKKSQRQRLDDSISAMIILDEYLKALS